ncbi:MAG TPA: S16 family serine protease [Thermaerobacter sp.]
MKAGRRAAVLAVMLAAVVLVARLPTAWIVAEPGRALPLQAVAPRSDSGGEAGQDGSRGTYLLVTVGVRTARGADVMAGLLRRDRALWPRSVLGTGDPEAVARAQRQALLASQREAVAAAARLLGREAVPELRFHLPAEFGGPSGGLAFALAAVDALSPGDLSAGLRVAATGTVRADGSVGPVAGTALKEVAAARAGADVFFVPRGTVAGGAAGSGSGGSPQRVEVSHLREAVRWLCLHGGQSPACAGF